ncbi:hypothetical protein [Pseudoalteromonas tunicata]|uniref:ATPase involved in DNA repair n=1 Tax=Pseudoalteromonas tunicata D2 TaxID=87626 RepID=A4CBL3_9GAMM|nr:hypothetical protein [Pseudoalteromonas tunicata]ATC94306.1 hypothetical protein PTUN_a1711 [Pseudoalteromonas tunicata]AXT30048.1 hypothetical protein D1819_04035 [Pseudoalteromonas tunicata]EAR27750.1 hypothetical protein PTD2_18050 [Pseudoalteromonas tunicata D2]MDP4983123.1 hypothetical protein [Pseudoalteromonas tunicata]MDP5211527.1 hypothetical protein [Pseudoalteromonas tunicata]
MIVAIILVLIVALIVIAVWVNAVQQHREKQEIERRQELTKHKKVIEETEDILMNAANLPMSSALIGVLHKRIVDSLRAMCELSPTSKELKSRLVESNERMQNSQSTDSSAGDKIVLPDNDKQIIALVQGIKKLRNLLRSEHSKGKVDTQIFLNEDKRLEKLQLRINVESQAKRGMAARSANMLGSARQYFEKAIATLSAQTYSDEYISSKKAEIENLLEEITNELKVTNATDRKKKAEQEQDDLDVLFAPKKKW